MGINGSNRPWWGDDDEGCNILHVDMDCFFASVETLDHPEIAQKPVIVGGLGSRGVVSAANYEARRYGVHSAQAMAQARRLCPNAHFFAPRMGRYEELSKQVMEVLDAISLQVEKISIDEAFLDVSGARLLLGSPLKIGKLIRERIRSHTGLCASVGIGENPFLAKLASQRAKPDGILLISAQYSHSFLESLPVKELWGVGPQTEKRLARYGILSVPQLLEVDLVTLEKILGESVGTHLYSLARGIDPRTVGGEESEKSFSTEHTFGDDVHNLEPIKRLLLAQSHDCARRLRQQHFLAKNVGIKIRFGDFTTVTRSRSIPAATDVGKEIWKITCELMDELSLPACGVRLVGVRVSRLSSGQTGVIIPLDYDPKTRLAEEVSDSIAARFGTDAILPARLVVRASEKSRTAKNPK